MAYFTTQAFEKAENKVLKYAVVNPQYAAEISDELAASPQFEQIIIGDNDDYAQLIKNDRVDFVVVMPDNYSSNVLSSGQLEITLYLNDAGLNLVYNRVNSIVQNYATQYQTAAFTTLGVSSKQQQALIIKLTK